MSSFIVETMAAFHTMPLETIYQASVGRQRSGENLKIGTPFDAFHPFVQL